MSEITAIENTFTKLKNNKYDISKLTPEEYEMLLKYAPSLLEASTKFVQEGSKAQEKVFSAIDKAMDIFAEQLKDPNLTSEEREKLNDRIERMVEQSLKKDTEFKWWMLCIASAAVGGAGLYLKAKNPNILRNS
jgi:transcriptional accessory protein Tex/SPT6